MKKMIATIYAVICTLLLVAGFLLVFGFAWQAGTWFTVEAIIGFAISFALAPIIHELGHVIFALCSKMDYVYVKCFCIKIYLKDGKKRFALALPFASDETQVLPKCGGNIKKRAVRYTVGGLVFSGVYLVIILTAALICAAFGKWQFSLWSLLPYTAYLFLLNALPFEYASGKTDALVYRGIKKEYGAEKNMLAAMEIQGQLYEGKRFSEIDENYYFDVPQLCEDEPLFAVMLDLRYRYYLDKGDFEKAAECLNRLASLQSYLPDAEVERIAAELTYMHVMNGDIERANECAKLCEKYLQGNSATAKRVLLAYSKAVGNTDAIENIKKQAREALNRERIVGVRLLEEKLIF